MDLDTLLSLKSRYGYAVILVEWVLETLGTFWEPYIDNTIIEE